MKIIESDLLHFILNSPLARPPTKGTPQAAGFDLHSIESCVLAAGSTTLISTDVGILVPAGSYARIAPRSGLSMHGILVGAGVIDRDFQSSIKVVLHNVGKLKYVINKHDKIAQIIIEKIFELSPIIRYDMPTKVVTIRGSSGFGSTGR